MERLHTALPMRVSIQTSCQVSFLGHLETVLVAANMSSLQGALSSLPVLATASQNETHPREGYEWPRAL